MSQKPSGQMWLFENPAHSSVSRLSVEPSQPPQATVSIQLCVLGSGSAGNSTVVRLGGSAMLIDAGFGPRATATRLAAMDLSLDDIDSICLTHLDRDHFSPNWINTLLAKRIGLYVHSRHVACLYRNDRAPMLHRAGLLHLIQGEPFEPATGFRVRAIALPHDQKGTMGFLLESPAGRIGYATDLGRVPDSLIQKFSGVDLLAIESNYDPQMQQASSRPPVLKHRIMGGYGHLSNQQAFEAVGRIIDASPNGGPRHVVLLHRSRQCNCPVLVRRLFAQDPRVASRLCLADQSQATPWLAV